MKDRFKFRVWWKKEKCWVESMMLCNLGFLAMQNGTDIEDDGFNEKDLVIQQCTSIKDVKGNLIYEGDILKVVNGSINGIGLSNKWVVKWVGSGWNIDQWTFDSTHSYEVIGNIYENKELLKEQK